MIKGFHVLLSSADPKADQLRRDSTRSQVGRLVGPAGFERATDGLRVRPPNPSDQGIRSNPLSLVRVWCKLSGVPTRNCDVAVTFLGGIVHGIPEPSAIHVESVPARTWRQCRPAARNQIER